METKKAGMFMTRQIASDASKDEAFHTELFNCTLRYFNRDWGDLCKEDKSMNEKALKNGGRLLAAYLTSKGKIYIITDDTKAMPQTTTLLYANEY